MFMPAIMRSHGYRSTKVVPVFSMLIMAALLMLGPFLGVAAAAAIPAIREIPAAVAAVHPELVSRRATLLQERSVLRQRDNEHNKQCSAVEQGSAADRLCLAARAALAADIDRHIKASNEFTVTADCQIAESQAEKDRAEIERNLRGLETGQEELAEWSKLNDEAQKGALEAALVFAMGTYAADAELVGKSVMKLENQATALAKKAARSRKYQPRMKYIAQLQSKLDQTKLKLTVAWAKSAVSTASDAEKAWSVARNTMRNEFRNASKENQAIRDVLQDPGFRDAFTGDDIDTPGLDVLATLTEQTLEDSGKMELGLRKYEKVMGPSIRAAVFVRDASYNALLSLLSTQRVLQQNDLAGNYAKAAGVLQARYKNTIDALRACKSR